MVTNFFRLVSTQRQQLAQARSSEFSKARTAGWSCVANEVNLVRHHDGSGMA